MDHCGGMQTTSTLSLLHDFPLLQQNRALMCMIKSERRWCVTGSWWQKNEPFCQFISGLMFFWWIYQREQTHPHVTHTHAPLLTNTHTQGNLCFSATRQLWLLSSIFSPGLFFPPSICLSVRLSEENGSWWAASCLMTWLIWGRLVCSLCVFHLATLTERYTLILTS